MRIAGNSHEGHGRLRGAVEVVARAAKPIVVGVKPMLEPLIGPPLDEQGIWERQARGPQVKAELGAAAVEESRQGDGDPQLHDFGIAMAVTALTDLDKPAAAIAAPEIPEVVTGIVEALLPTPAAGAEAVSPPQVMAASPYISPETAAHASAILGKTGHAPQFP